MDGPPGRVRPTGRCLAIGVATLGIGLYVWNYRVHSEMKAHSGRGVGGGIALLLTFVANIAMPFVTSAEVGGLYTRRGLPEPVRGWTGLWVLLPVVLGYALVLGALFFTLSAPTATTGSDGGSVAVAVFFFAALVYGVAVLAGVILWFVKTNGALNRYWESLR
jgi:hypothetical protein